MDALYNKVYMAYEIGQDYDDILLCFLVHLIVESFPGRLFLQYNQMSACDALVAQP